MKWFLVLALAVVAVVADHEMYDGFKTYRIQPTQDAQLHTLKTLGEVIELDFWQNPMKIREGILMVAPQDQDLFVETMEKNNIPVEVRNENVKALFEEEDKILYEANRMSKKDGNRLNYDTYPRYADIDAYMQYLGQQFPGTVTVVSGGSSSQGRDIKYVKVSTTNFQDTSKPIIVMEGGIHAREWISSPSVTYAIRKLTEDVTENDLLQGADWIIVPLINPDGYEFSHTNTRLWRKTRSTSHFGGSLCPGVDGNRNFDFRWMEAGSSQIACREIYAGPNAFSEPETRIIRDILFENLSRIELYLTIHSHGSYILYPWGNNGSLPTNGLELHTLGVQMANAIDGRALPTAAKYIVGNSGLALNYFASGASEDYARSVGVELSYTYELPGLGGGFVLHPQHILQVVQETWEGYVVGARYAISKRRNKLELARRL